MAEEPDSPLLPGWHPFQAAGTYSPSMQQVLDHLRAALVLVACCLVGPL